MTRPPVSISPPRRGQCPPSGSGVRCRQTRHAQAGSCGQGRSGPRGSPQRSRREGSQRRDGSRAGRLAERSPRRRGWGLASWAGAASPAGSPGAGHPPPFPTGRTRRSPVCRPHEGDHFGTGEAVEDVQSIPAASNEPGVRQPGELLGDLGLPLPQPPLEVADTGLPVPLKDIDDLQPQRMTEGPEETCGLVEGFHPILLRLDPPSIFHIQNIECRPIGSVPNVT
jgi:hypothetical protein